MIPSSPPGSRIVGSKMELRRAALERRNDLAGAAPEAANAVAARIAKLLGHYRGVIAGYMPIGSELDPIPALKILAESGAEVVLPVAAARGDRLVFRLWTPGDPLITGPFGTLHPGPGARACDPDILLIPLLAFDLNGHRLGYGAGYYDRTLAALRAERAIAAIGLAFDGQEVPPLPCDGHDQPLDMIVTDRRTLRVTDKLNLLSPTAGS